jgi:hypothetical protein
MDPFTGNTPVELVEKSAKMPVREVSSPPQVQRVDRRLPAGTIAELVQAYRDGVSTPELRRQYELSQGSVIKILHSRGVVMRNQGLVDTDIAIAAELYRSGKTLAELGEQCGVSPNAVRRTLISSDVVMRARGGSSPRASGRASNPVRAACLWPVGAMYGRDARSPVRRRNTLH